MITEKEAAEDRQRIVRAATRLFAALGLDGTPTELIAEAAGVPPGTSRRYFRSNTDLYREVMERAAAAERKALADALDAFTPTHQGMVRVLDAYLDFYASEPDMLGLWLHRRAGDAADTADLDERHSRAKLTWIAAAVRDAVPDPSGLDYALWTFPWVVSGFLGHGMVYSADRGGRFGDGHVNRQQLEEFRAYLHTLAARVLALPGAPGRDAPDHTSS
ncbi:hypothetical protein GCM10009678_19020 [Actinomadura kijaniata]|uniref:AcrR family transcriptional regulator n=1 Tax=Actinomadura namibiensis TaxID=182080 RepID=A0A7W3LXJ7_ACTNM|nr:TetR/AcrR family transcriptional regulator [Actinomadura namibiensis]MBA8956148.1 AcrR family transcriptional regulator [Actinomadura namibiensis]